MIKSLSITGFIGYIIFIVIILYLDSTFSLDGFLLLGILIISFLYLDNINDLIKTMTSRGFNPSILFFSILFAITFLFFYYFTFQLLFDENNDFTRQLNYSLLDYLMALFFFPILEEIIFRRNLLRLLLQKNSVKKSIILLSIGFAICHYFTYTGLLYAFFGSLFYSYLYLKTNNIWMCISIHGFHNLLILFILPLISIEMFYSFKYPLLYIFVTLILLLILNVFILIKIFKD